MAILSVPIHGAGDIGKQKRTGAKHKASAATGMRIRSNPPNQSKHGGGWQPKKERNR